MRWNKQLFVLIALIMLIGTLSPAVLAQSQTYAYDTLFDSGRALTVSYLGGSITEGAGANGSQRWTTLLTKEFFNGTYQERYGTGTATEVNAGIGGTPSSLGLFRLRNDVTQHAPDIVFVEFAVNDAGDASSESGALLVKQRMEGIVRQLQKLPKQPVVIFIYTAAWKEDTQFDLPLNCAKEHQKVADYYGIPSINLCEYVAGGVDLDGNPIVWDKNAEGTWTGDNTHPNALGYQKYYEYIAKQLSDHPEQYFKKMTERELPKFGYEYGSPDLVSASDTSRATYSSQWQAGGSEWPFRSTTNNVMYTTEAGATAQFSFQGRSIGLYVLRGDRGNSASYTVTNDEGTVVKQGTVSNHYRHASSYNASAPKGTTMACSTLLLNGLPFDDYTLTLTTNAITTDQNGYTKDLFAIGYFMVDETAPEVEAPAYVEPSLSIEKTDTSLSRADKDNPETAYVQVEYTDSLGTTVLNSDTVHTQGVTFESSDPSVISIDQQGLMTPIQEGTSFVSVSYDGVVSQKLMVIVYSEISSSVNKTWDSDTLGTNSTVLSSVHDDTLKFQNTYEIMTGGHESDSQGQSVHYFTLDKPTMGVDDYAKGLGDTWKSSTNYVHQQLTGAASASDQASVMEMWFYDNGGTSDMHFWLSSITAAGVNDAATLGKPQDLRHTFKTDPNYYMMVRNSNCGTWASKEAYYAAAADQRAVIAANPNAGITMAWAPAMTLYNNKAPRSKGWHQFVWDASQDYITRVYVDGIMIGEIDTSELGIDFVAHQVPAVRFDRYYNRGTDPKNQEMTIDNISLYATKSTGVNISGLSMHHNPTSFTVGETGKLTAKGVLADGSLTELPAGQASFSTMDDTVLSLDSDGTLTAVGVGVAKVTAKSGEYSATLSVVVSQSQAVTKVSFDDMSSSAIADCSSAQSGTRKVSDSYEYTSEKTRTGTGLSLHFKNICIDQMGNDTFKTYLSDALTVGTDTTDYVNYTIPGMNSGNAAGRGLAEVWFYDTKEVTSRHQFWISGYRTELSGAVGCDTMRFAVTFGAETYGGFDGHNAAGYPTFTKYSVPRTKGWHQLLIDYSQENTYSYYIDGQLLATRTAEGWNGGISGIRVDRFVKAKDMTALTDTLPLQMYVDDCAIYDMSWDSAPVLAETEISDLDVTQTVTYYDQSASGQIRAKAVQTNGRKFDVSGDSSLSYSVSDPTVLTVGEDGTIQPLKIGYALVTVTAQGANNTAASKKLLITVGSSGQTVLVDANSDTPLKAKDASYEYSTDVYRTGKHSYHMLTNHIWNDVPRYKNNDKYFSFVFSGWLYDEGVGSSSIPRFVVISANPGGKNNMNLSFGIQNTGDAYYQLNNNEASRATWAPGALAGNLGATGQYKGNTFSGQLNGVSVASTQSFTNPQTGTVTTYTGPTSGVAERSRGWHQFAIVCDGGGTDSSNLSTPNGKMEFYIDGELVMTDRYVPTYAHGFWVEQTGYISDYQVTHYAVERQAPVASHVTLGTEGNVISQRAYTASADVTDPNGYGQEAVTSYGWEISDNGADGWTEASSEAAYTPADAGKYVRAFAQPTGSIDGLTGEKAYSEVQQIGVENPKLTFTLTGSGTVQDDDGISYGTGENMTAANGDNITLQLVPETGYQVSSVKAGDKELVVNDQNEIVLENINLDTALTVVFTERQKEKPAASSSDQVMTQKDYLPKEDAQPVFSAILYSKIQPGYGYDVLEAGVKLVKDDKSLLLPILGTWSDTYQYGIRVFGEGLTEGSYQMIPYVKIKSSDSAEDSEEYVYGSAEGFVKEAE